jgi:hypothetical protein
LVVVDLSVEHYPDGAILIVDRLVTRVYVDDRQSTHTQRSTIAEVIAFVIGATMRQQCAHFLRARLVSPTDISTDNANNTAHVIYSQG